jgi:predicted small secreted protein
MKNTFKFLPFILLTVASLSSCNTMVGLGRDMRVLGTEMEKKADQSLGGGTGSNEYGGAPVY